jgi:hypothetical protein
VLRCINTQHHQPATALLSVSSCKCQRDPLGNDDPREGMRVRRGERRKVSGTFTTSSRNLPVSFTERGRELARERKRCLESSSCVDSGPDMIQTCPETAPTNRQDRQGKKTLKWRAKCRGCTFLADLIENLCTKAQLGSLQQDIAWKH